VEALPVRSDAVASAAFLAGVERRLHGALRDARDRIAPAAPEATGLLDELERVVAAGGKRLRPLFCLWGYRAGAGADVAALVDAGAAVELLHTAALVHDDVLDGSRIRRGRPASHRALGALAPAAAERFGSAAAVLAGDLAQALSEEVLSRARFPPDRVAEALARMAASRIDAVAGEYVDVLAACDRGAVELTEERARAVARLKSGSYSIVGPLLVGAALAGAPTGVADALRGYGEPLGEAFQLRDDLLGVFGTPSRPWTR
jgi:geranylgeranyl diphosphate synthase type I